MHIRQSIKEMAGRRYYVLLIFMSYIGGRRYVGGIHIHIHIHNTYVASRRGSRQEFTEY